VSEQPAEFYGSVQIMPESDPATDPLMTVRMQPPNTWLRRYDGRTLRVVKLDTDTLSWREVGDGYYHGDGWRTNDEVKDWPVQHPLVWGVAYDRLAGKAVPPPAGRAGSAPELEGDMGVESFRG
jgi:hypothetical protein